MLVGLVLRAIKVIIQGFTDTQTDSRGVRDEMIIGAVKALPTASPT